MRSIWRRRSEHVIAECPPWNSVHPLHWPDAVLVIAVRFRTPITEPLEATGSRIKGGSSDSCSFVRRLPRREEIGWRRCRVVQHEDLIADRNGLGEASSVNDNLMRTVGCQADDQSTGFHV
jgi:hypothetical protein